MSFCSLKTSVSKKKIAFISVARSDFGRMYPSLVKIQESEDLQLQMIVSGNHCSDKFGSSIDEITSSGLNVDHVLDLKSTDMAGVSSEILTGLNELFKTDPPDHLIILGDRYEMLAAAQAAFLRNIPIIHVGGGYQTSGAIDDRIRHAISQLSTYHFTATEKCRQRVKELIGSEENVFLSGAPDLEILKNVELMSKEQFYKECNLQGNRPFILVTLHPETLKSEKENEVFVGEFEKFLLAVDEQILMTAPCADPGSELVFAMIERLKESRNDFTYIESLGMKRYASAMNYAELMAGNSSSGIIESATMGIQVINAGQRQGGREVNANVIHSPFKFEDLMASYKSSKCPKFKKMSSKIANIYGDGTFSERFLSFINILK